MTRPAGFLCRGGCSILLGSVLAGCATPPLQSARHDFYSGRLDQADRNLSEIPAPLTDRVLFLMERGTVRHARHDYQGSIRDWLDAVEAERELETYSLSRGSASLIVNDQTLSFRGAPYERTLLRAMLAQNYMALGLWDDVAVEGRNIVQNMQDLQGFPDDAFSRYVAGFSFEMIGDDSNAALQYRTAAAQLNGIGIDEATGTLMLVSTNGPPAVPSPSAPRPGPHEAELVCFVSMGQTPCGLGMSAEECRGCPAPYAEIYAGGRCLGRSYPLANTADLLVATQKRVAALRAAKTVARIALKESIAEAVRKNNKALGDLLWFALFAMEQPDVRRWETLPLWLEVARVPCPSDLKDYEVLFKNADDSVIRRTTVATPLTRKGRAYVSFCRDLPPQEPLPPAPN